MLAVTALCPRWQVQQGERRSVVYEQRQRCGVEEAPGAGTEQDLAEAAVAEGAHHEHPRPNLSRAPHQEFGRVVGRDTGFKGRLDTVRRQEGARPRRNSEIGGTHLCFEVEDVFASAERLRAEGIVQTRREGKSVIYSLARAEVAMVVSALKDAFCRK